MERMNKTELILSLPASLTASQVVSEAKKRGIKLSAQLVYVVRRKQASGAPRRGPGRPRKHPQPVAAPKRGPGGPRKHPLPVALPKRGPGRPRKHPLPVAAPKVSKRLSKAPSGSLTANEKELARLLMVLGLHRVEQLIRLVKRTLR